ncbi:hypothetical protein CBF23_000265 [Marinomonas agarivorans]|nr:hypothetical protein CBF23_000265 [Marinomonas agarivorans]
MIKPKPTKTETRDEIALQVEEFLQRQGKIEQVKMGDSGLVDGKYHTNHIGFNEPKQTRTPLNHVVAEIQNRKKPQKMKKRPTKKVIYDDFGEPIRWYWEE